MSVAFAYWPARLYTPAMSRYVIENWLAPARSSAGFGSRETVQPLRGLCEHYRRRLAEKRRLRGELECPLYDLERFLQLLHHGGRDRSSRPVHRLLWCIKRRIAPQRRWRGTWNPAQTGLERFDFKVLAVNLANPGVLYLGGVGGLYQFSGAAWTSLKFARDPGRGPVSISALDCARPFPRDRFHQSERALCE